MKKSEIEAKDELRPEYEMAQLLKGAVRGKYVEQYRQGTNLILHEPDVAAAFPTPEAVNESLRLVMRLAAIPTAKPSRIRKRKVTAA